MKHHICPRDLSTITQCLQTRFNYKLVVVIICRLKHRLHSLSLVSFVSQSYSDFTTEEYVKH